MHNILLFVGREFVITACNGNLASTVLRPGWNPNCASEITSRAVLTHGPNGHLPGDPTSIGAPQELHKSLSALPCPGDHYAIKTALITSLAEGSGLFTRLVISLDY